MNNNHVSYCRCEAIYTPDHQIAIGTAMERAGGDDIFYGTEGVVLAPNTY
jgi:hypothetical protein